MATSDRNESAERGQSEFGSGVVVCLAKFSEHLERFLRDNQRAPDARLVEIYGSSETYESSQIEMWINGASDHFYDLDRTVAPKPLCELADLALSVGHGFTGEVWTKETVERIRALWKEACLAVDRRLGIEPDWGQW